jgi:hypothetical protein
MRLIFGLSALALLAAAPAVAQPQSGAPRGSYERQCTNIRMQGQFLSAICRGPSGPATSSINVLSCSTDIFVGPDGGLACVGPGGGAPPAIRDAPPGYATPDGRADRGYRGERGRRAETATLSPARNWGGRPLTIEGPMPDLDRTGLNDQVRSIRLARGSGPWIVCTDADYRGRCTTIYDSVADTRRIGMRDSISSLRPLR